MAVTKLLKVANFYLFRLDPRVETFIGLLLTTGTIALVLLRSTRSWSGSTIDISIRWITIICLSFSLRGIENLLAPWIVNGASTFFFFVVSLLFLEGKSRTAFFTALISGLLCALSFTNGLIVWPIGALYLFALRQPKRAWIWISVAAGFFACYMTTFRGVSGPGIGDPLSSMARLMLLIGDPVTFDPGIIRANDNASALSLVAVAVAGLLFAVLSVLTFVPIVRKQIFMQARFPIALFLFGLVSCALIAVGRSGSGLQILSSRYFGTVAILWTGYLLLLDHVTPLLPKFSRALTILLCASAVGASLFAGYINLDYALRSKQYLIGWRERVLHYETSDLTNPHFPVEYVSKQAEFLKTYGLHPF